MSHYDLIKKRGEQLYFPDFKTKRSSRRWYQHDIDIIIYSEMFRKMQRKSQLFAIQDPISRSRLIHTFEVVRIAKEISEKLELNSELTEAIALAHDFGNVAYGKPANDFLVSKTNGLFKHEEVSALMLKVSASRLIPDKFRNLAKDAIREDDAVTHIIEIEEFPYSLEVFEYNQKIYYICISPEIIDGIIKHGTSETAFTLEGQIVNYADNIAYLVQDISDFEATGIFDNDVKERYGSCLEDLESKDNNSTFPLTGIVGKTTSIRTATLIERYVEYNSERLKSGNYNTVFSDILKSDIPVLEIEQIVRDAIDKCWEFKKELYGMDLIRVSNITSKSRMEQVWDIIKKGSSFDKYNNAYRDFIEMLDSPIFNSFRAEKGIDKENDWKKWKKAYFVAHLTCDEIDLIVKSFLERDYEFNLSLPKIGEY